jgi:NNP family nitrate/nitrite transporter-like MFS transporter
MAKHTALNSPDKGAMTLTSALPHLLLLAAIFFATFLARILLAPLLPAIQSELSFDSRSAGSLFFVLSGGYFVSLLSTSYLAARLQHRTLIIVSCFGLSLALATGAAVTTVRGLHATAFLLGLAAGLYLPSGISAVTHLTAPPHWGRALAIHELAPNLAFILAPLAAEAMLGHTGWRSGLALTGGGTALLGLLYAFSGRGAAFRGIMPDRQAARGLLGQPFVWLLVAMFGLGIASTLGTYTMLPLYLVAWHGLDLADANTLLSVSRLAALPMALAGGWIADRFGPRATLGGVFCLTGLTTMALGLTDGGLLRGAVLCQPVLAVCFFPAGFSALSALSPPGYRNLAVALIIPAAFLAGGGGVPLAIGWLGEAGYFPQAFVLVGTLITLGAFLTVRLPSPDSGL